MLFRALIVLAQNTTAVDQSDCNIVIERNSGNRAHTIVTIQHTGTMFHPVVQRVQLTDWLSALAEVGVGGVASYIATMYYFHVQYVFKPK